MSTKIVINPLTRISGFLQIEVQVEHHTIVDAKSSGMMFRGFEKMLRGRNPADAIYFTERICGICSTAHSMASALALEDALAVVPNENSRMIRDYIHGCEFLQNHLRHFYQYTLPDYVRGPEIQPIFQVNPLAYRLPRPLEDKIALHYRQSLEFSRKAHEMLATLGGKAPHHHGVFIGGVTVNLDASIFIEIKSILSAINHFITNVMIPDVYTIADYYSDCFEMGAGKGNLMSYGLFDTYQAKELFYLCPAVMENGIRREFSPARITESVYHAWYRPESPGAVPAQEEDIKTDGYSFIKAPRYDGIAMEVGPLARMILSGNYPPRVSAMDRTIARVLEAKKITDIMQGLLERIKPEPSQLSNYTFDQNVMGKGLTDTTRGALGHWIKIEDHAIQHYSIISPSTWNLSPEDEFGVKGVAESALIGTPLADIKNPMEIGRIVRSFDPCVSCATHVLSDTCQPFEIRVV